MIPYVFVGRRAGWRAVAGLLTTAMLSVGLAFAQDNATGNIAGVVANRGTGQFLTQAEVRVHGTNRAVQTDRDGSYRLLGLPPGTYTLVAEYTGLDSLTREVTVVAGTTSKADFDLTAEVYRLETQVVAAEREGNAYALNRRQKSEYLMEAISSDVFGSVTEGNAGEFLKNLPGVQIEYNAADARAMRIRGQDSFLTNVTIDGAQYANASSSNTTRVFEVDQISIHNIESIEVFKAPPPSQSPAIGGTVNLTTKSAFEQKGRRVVLTTNLNANSEDLVLGRTPGPGGRHTHKIGIGGTLNYSEAFFDNTFGVSLTLAESNQHNEQHTITKGYTFPTINTATTQVTADTPGYLSLYQILDGPKYANRRNVGLNLDYKLSNTTTVALKNSFGRYEAQVRDRTFRLRGNTPQPGYHVGDVTFAAGAAVRADTGYSFFDKNSRDWSSRLAVKHKLDVYTINYDFGFSKSTNHYNSLPNMARGLNLDLPNIGFRLIQAPNSADVTVVQTAGPDLFNYSSYVVSSGTTVSDTDRNSGDFILSGQLDVRREFAKSRLPFYLQTGYAWRRQQRSILRPDPNYQHVGVDGVAGTAAQDALPVGLFRDVVYTNSPGFGLPAIPWASPFAVRAYWNENPQAFIEGTQAQANAIRKTTSYRFFEETVNAAYLMGGFKLGRLNALTGARIELTDFEATDYDTRPSLPVEQRYTRRTRNVNYDPPIFKNLQLRYKHYNSNKLGKTNRAEFPPAIGRIIDEFNTPEFTAFMSQLTGIPGLIADPSLEGGGMHQTERDGFLNVHADFTMHHHQTQWRRRVNLILYLNDGWQKEWGGELELWDRQMKRCAVKIPPVLNSIAVFNTDDTSFHGYPDPIQFPRDVTRKSLALYYYTVETDPTYVAKSTNYQARPGQSQRSVFLIWADKKAVHLYSLLKKKLGLSDDFLFRLLNTFGRRKK